MYDKLWEDIYKATGVKKPKMAPEQEKQWDDMLEGILIRCLADTIRNEIPKAYPAEKQYVLTPEEEERYDKMIEESMKELGLLDDEIVTEDGEIVPRDQAPSVQE